MIDQSNGLIILEKSLWIIWNLIHSTCAKIVHEVERNEIHLRIDFLLLRKEYLEDYASDETKEIGEKLIRKEIETIQNEKIKTAVIENLKKIEQGGRDYKF